MTEGVSRRSPRASGAVICSLCCIASPHPASAGAWNRPAGEGLAIFDYTLDAGSDYFDGSGRLAPAQRYSKSELAAYVEYGATDRLTLIARPSCSAQKPMALSARYVGTDRGC